MDFSELEERPPTHTLEDPAGVLLLYIVPSTPVSPSISKNGPQEKVSLFRLASLFFSPFAGRGETAPKKSEEEEDVEKEGEEEDRKERRCCAGGGKGWFSNGRRKEEEGGVVRWENSILRAAACQKRLAGRGKWKIGSSGSGRQWLLSRDSLSPDTKICCATVCTLRVCSISYSG